MEDDTSRVSLTPPRAHESGSQAKTTRAGFTESVAPGTMVDHFRIIRSVGSGGMGEVYLARDTQLGRKVALKIIKPERLTSPEARDRILQEARITARFNHPHIVMIYAVGEHQERPYLALEYLEGQTLEARMRDERLGVQQAIRVGLVIAEALDEAHRNQILHRDLKPANVFIPRDGRIRVLDFGIAEAAVKKSQATQLANVVAGTPLYLAPELWKGELASEASDIWALGIMLYELVSGRRPFTETSPPGLYRQVTAPETMPELPASIDVPPELRALVGELLDKDPASRLTASAVMERLQGLLTPDRVRISHTQSPFRGLLPFVERHADFFYGREGEVTAVLERLREQVVIPVVGPSGAGKSSFVLAGVIPRLREQGAYMVLKLRPGRQPFRTLANSLVSEDTFSHELPTVATTPSSIDRLGAVIPVASADAAAKRADTEDLAAKIYDSPPLLNLLLQEAAEANQCRVVLVVDQLEEIYNLVSDEEVRRRFMRAVCGVADDPLGGVRVILTLRDDFLGHLAEERTVREALRQVTVLGRLTPAALRETLVRPLKAVGYQYSDPELVPEMIQSIAGEVAGLPLLQFAAARLWDRRDEERKLLTRAAYEAMGGVAGALAEHADGVLSGMSAAQVRLARSLFLRLVTAEGTRRVLSRAQLLEDLADEAAGVLHELTRARLILVRKGKAEAQGELEITHESLTLSWATLRRWIEESREDLVFLSEAEQAAALWEKRGFREAEVWQGEPLAHALHQAARLPTLPELVRRFLAAAEQREQRQVRRKRVLVGSGFVTLLLVAVISVGVSWRMREQQRETLRQKEQAQAQRAEARAQRAAAQAQRAETEHASARAALALGDPLQARARLRLGLELGDSRLARSLLWQLRKAPLVWKREFSTQLYSVAFSPDGRLVAAGSMDHGVYLIDRYTGLVTVLRGHRDQVFSVAFGPSGKYLVSGGWDGEILLWDVGASRSTRLGGHKGEVTGLAFGPNGKRIASGSSDRTVRLWDLRSGKLRRVLRGHTSTIRCVAFSPKGDTLASGSVDTTIRLWDARSGKARPVLRGHQRIVRGVAFSPKGKMVASGSDDSTVRLWDVRTGEERLVLRGHRAAVMGVSFSPRGETLASGSYDRTVRLWDLRTGKARRVLHGHEAAVRSVAFSPKGEALASGSLDKTVRLWNPHVGQARRRRYGHEAAVYGLAFSPGGETFASASRDKTVRLWNVRTGKERRVLRGHAGAVYDVAFSPKGEMLASGGADRTVRLWDAQVGKALGVLRGHAGAVHNVAFSPGGNTLASGSNDRTVRLWTMRTGKASRILRGHELPIASFAFSPKGETLASGATDKTVRLWDLRTGRTRVVLRGHSLTVYGVAFGPEHKTLASGSFDKTVRLWDLRSGTSRVVGRHRGRVYALDFHPDGRRIGAPDSSGEARIWHLAKGGYVALRGHQGEVNFLRFSPDGKLVATSSDDGTVRLWDAQTGQPVWRAPLLRPRRLTLLTHLGWLSLVSGKIVRPPVTEWRKTVAEQARAAAESTDGLLCLATHDERLQVWDVAKDRRLAETRVPGLTDVLAVPRGCVSWATRSGSGRSGGTARRHDRTGAQRILQQGATAIGWDDAAREILVAAGSKVHIHGSFGAVRRSIPAGLAPTAIARVGAFIVMGYKDGNVELRPLRPGVKKPAFIFELVPASPVVRIVAGPAGTVALGFASGLVGLWSMDNGQRLEHGRIHGPVIHLVRREKKLYAATGLGDHLVWDLSLFYEPYCKVLRRVWARVPIVWEKGLPVRRAPPADHRCRRGLGLKGVGTK